MSSPAPAPAAAAAADGGDQTQVTDSSKKKKLTNHLEKSDGRRLVEYLVVVSSLPRESVAKNSNSNSNINDDDDEKKETPPDTNNNEQEQYRLSTEFDDDDIELVDHEGFKPIVTSRYPYYDHEDNPFDPNVCYFCHISGAIQLKKNPYMPKVRTNERTIPVALRYVTLVRSSTYASLVRRMRANDMKQSISLRTPHGIIRAMQTLRCYAPRLFLLCFSPTRTHTHLCLCLLLCFHWNQFNRIESNCVWHFFFNRCFFVCTVIGTGTQIIDAVLFNLHPRNYKTLRYHQSHGQNTGIVLYCIVLH